MCCMAHFSAQSQLNNIGNAHCRRVKAANLAVKAEAHIVIKTGRAVLTGAS